MLALGPFTFAIPSSTHTVQTAAVFGCSTRLAEAISRTCRSSSFSNNSRNRFARGESTLPNGSSSMRRSQIEPRSGRCFLTRSTNANLIASATMTSRPPALTSGPSRSRSWRVGLKSLSTLTASGGRELSPSFFTISSIVVSKRDRTSSSSVRTPTALADISTTACARFQHSRSRRSRSLRFSRACSLAARHSISASATSASRRWCSSSR